METNNAIATLTFTTIAMPATRKPSVARILGKSVALTAKALILTAKDRVRVGRPVKRDLSEMVNHVSMIAEAERALRSRGARAWYVGASVLRRDLTDDERAIVALTDEATYQGILPCGDPAQSELFIQTPCRVTKDDEDGSAFVAEAKRALKMIRAACQDEHKARRQAERETGEEYVEPIMVLRVERNAITRIERNGSKSQRAAFRAKYGCRFYGTDRLTPREGEYTLATITPNQGERTDLAAYEWDVEGMA